MRRNPEAQRRAAERRRRENDAERLREVVPELRSLSLVIEESCVNGVADAVTHIRRIVIERAPALFDLPCCDRHCKDGGHDITAHVMRALRQGRTRFEGADSCGGTLKVGECTRELRYMGEATYELELPAAADLELATA